MSEKRFYMVLVDFVSALSIRFPENEGVKMAKMGLGLANTSSGHTMIMSKWKELTLPLIEDIKKKNNQVIGNAMDSCDVSILADIQAGKSMLMSTEVDEDTKEKIWKFIHLLTSIAHGQNIVPVPPAATPPPTPAPVMPAPGATPPAVPSGNQIAKGIKEGLPQIIEAFQEVMKGEEGKPNPVGDFIKMMMNPNQKPGPGLANNIFANLMEETPSSVMDQAAEQSGLTADEIVYRLQRLENLEKSRQARKKMKNQRTGGNSD